MLSKVQPLFYAALMSVDPASADFACLDDASPLARDVARGVARLFWRQGLVSLCEMPLGNGRRADILALDAKGSITIVEIKISRADLLGDRKWPDYLEFCDRYFWAVPRGFDLALLERDTLQPFDTGLLVADRYDAVIAREAPPRSLSAPRRRVETLRFARSAAARLLAAADPMLGGFD